MARKKRKAVKFDRPIVEVSADELRAAFRDVLTWEESGAATAGMTDIMRAVIQSERDYPSDSGIRDLRDIWYSSAKPVLSKLGMLRKPIRSRLSDQAFLKSRNDLVESAVSELVEEGVTSYWELGIVDHSRSKQPATDYVDNVVPGYAVSFGIHSNIVLATEKDTQYAELERIAMLYGCSVISGSGQCSFAAVEGLLLGMTQDLPTPGRPCRTLLSPLLTDEIVFLTFTDYDGYGFAIAETFADHMRHCVRNANVVGPPASGSLVTVRTERLGINLDQLRPDEVGNNKYELPENPVNRKWHEQTGGVYGEFYGLELNAMKHAQRIEIITSGLNRYIDPLAYAGRIRDSYVRKVALEAITGRIEEAIDATVRDMRSTIRPPDMTADDIQRLALDGQTEFSIDVGDDLANDIAGNVIAALRTRLAPEAK